MKLVSTHMFKSTTVDALIKKRNISAWISVGQIYLLCFRTSFRAWFRNGLMSRRTRASSDLHEYPEIFQHSRRIYSPGLQRWHRCRCFRFAAQIRLNYCIMVTNVAYDSSSSLSVTFLMSKRLKTIDDYHDYILTSFPRPVDWS